MIIPYSRNSSSFVFIDSLFPISRELNQPRCSSADNKNMVSLYNRILFSNYEYLQVNRYA